MPQIASQEQQFEKADPLLAEIRSFLDAVRTGEPPPVSGEDGRRALETAMRITQSLKESLALVARRA
jgi:predicted dehydrogenase